MGKRHETGGTVKRKGEKMDGGQRGGQKTGVNRGETKGKETAWCQTVGEGHDNVCPLLMTPTSVQLLCTLGWGRSSQRSGDV